MQISPNCENALKKRDTGGILALLSVMRRGGNWYGHGMHKMYSDYLQKRGDFYLRRNSDGTFDSICTWCFATAAKANIEEGLARLEHEHICDPTVVEQFMAVSRE
jgi:hypothetical protein